MAEGNDQREQRILDAAADLIAHYGYDKTTVDEIARAAGVSKGAIYLHFSSKEQLLGTLLRRETDRMKARYFELLDGDPQGVTIFTMYRYGLEIIDESPLIKALFTRDQRVLGDYLRKVRDTAAYSQLSSFTASAIRQFQQEGLIRADLDAETVFYLLNALQYGVLLIGEHSPGGQAPSVKALGETLAELLANGLAPRESGGDQQAARSMLEKLYEAKLKFVEQQSGEST